MILPYNPALPEASVRGGVHTGFHGPLIFLAYTQKQASVLDLPLFVNIRKQRQLRREKRRQSVLLRLAAKQGKAHRTLKFTYTNLRGETKPKEVQPYEIKKGFLWGVDIRDPRSIKKFFLSKIKGPQPGIVEFVPRWPVKFACIMATARLRT